MGKIQYHLVVSVFVLGDYDIIVIQDEEGELITIKITEDE